MQSYKEKSPTHCQRSFWLLCRKFKWNNVKRDFKFGDTVLQKDSTTHIIGQWLSYWNIQSAGHVQTVEIEADDSTFNNKKLFKMLIHLIQKIQLLPENHIVRFPDRETTACNDQDEMPSWGKPCITCSKACKLWTLNFLYFWNNSCNRNSLSKYLLKVRDRGNMLKFWVVNKDILIMLFVLFWVMSLFVLMFLSLA